MQHFHIAFNERVISQEKEIPQQAMSLQRAAGRTSRIKAYRFAERQECGKIFVATNTIYIFTPATTIYVNFVEYLNS
jgi:hypothetical protein